MTCVLTKYYSDDDIKVVRWVEHVARMGDSKGTYRVYWGNLRAGTTWKFQTWMGG